MIRGIPTTPFLAARVDNFVSARPRDEWTTVRSRRTYLQRHLLEKYGTTRLCRSNGMRGAHSEERRKRIKQEMVDAGEAFDTEIVKRPRSTDDPRSNDTVEPETKKARPDLDEITALDSLLCV